MSENLNKRKELFLNLKERFENCEDLFSRVKALEEWKLEKGKEFEKNLCVNACFSKEDLQNSADLQYFQNLEELLLRGTYHGDRTGTGTIRLFGTLNRFRNVSENFPLLESKKVYTKGSFYEILWMLAGKTNIQFLKDRNIGIWNKWADDSGELGPVYSEMWRKMPGFNNEQFDQIRDMMKELKEKPNSRQNLVVAFNRAANKVMTKNSEKAGRQIGLPACHSIFQIEIIDGKLYLLLLQRSCDMFLGVPFNRSQYALKMLLIAKNIGIEVGDFVHTMGDYHIYLNHLEQVCEQLSRAIELPFSKVQVKINADVNIAELDKATDEEIDMLCNSIEIIGYKPLSSIKGAVS